MAALTTPRYWQSDGSIASVSLSFLSKSPLSISNVIKVEKLQEPKKKGGKSIPTYAPWRTYKDPKNHVTEPSKVKPSALLYEITERTKQLAQPRVRVPETNSFQPRLVGSQIPEASARIIELSRPRMVYQQPSKLVGHVEPGALRAIATQRIIELSRPRRRCKAKSLKRKKLSYPQKQIKRSRNKIRRFRKSRKGGQRSPELETEELWCDAEHKKEKSYFSHSSTLPRKNEQKKRRTKVGRTRQHPIRSTYSNRTVIMIDLGKDSGVKPKRLHGFRHRKLY